MSLSKRPVSAFESAFDWIGLAFGLRQSQLLGGLDRQVNRAQCVVDEVGLMVGRESAAKYSLVAQIQTDTDNGFARF
jgi:hypothetical protein